MKNPQKESALAIVKEIKKLAYRDPKFGNDWKLTYYDQEYLVLRACRFLKLDKRASKKGRGK